MTLADGIGQLCACNHDEEDLWHQVLGENGPGWFVSTIHRRYETMAGVSWGFETAGFVYADGKPKLVYMIGGLESDTARRAHRVVRRRLRRIAA